MAEFRNPLQVTNMSAPSIQRPVVNTTGEQALGFLSSVAGLITQPKAPSQASIDEDLKTRGSQLAVQRLTRFHEMEKTEGRDVAKSWLDKVVLQDQADLGTETSRSSYYSVFKEQLGGSFLAEDERIKREIEAGQAKQVQDYLTRGSEALAAQGYDPETVDPNKRIILGQQQIGKAAQVNQEIQELALRSSQLNLADRERLIVSNTVYQQFSTESEGNLRAAISGYAQQIEANPNSRLQVTSELVANLRLQRSNLQNRLIERLNTNGGNLSDISSDQLTRLGNQIDAVIELVDGRLGLQLSQTELDRLSVDRALEMLPHLGNKGAANAILFNNALKVPLNSMNEVLSTFAGPTTPQSTRVAIARESAAGLGRAALTYNLTPQSAAQSYGVLKDTIVNLGKSTKPEYVQEAGQAIVDNLMEGISAPSRVRAVSNSAYGLPAMLGGLAKQQHTPELTAAVQEAAAAEGVEPADLWIESASTVMREKVAPALQLHDPNYTRNLDIKFEGGRFKVDYRGGFDDVPGRARDASRGSAGFGLGNLSRVRSLSDVGAQRPRVLSAESKKRAADLERVLNDYANSYARVMNARTDDVGPALLANIQLSLGLVNLQQEEN